MKKGIAFCLCLMFTASCSTDSGVEEKSDSKKEVLIPQFEEKPVLQEDPSNLNECTNLEFAPGTVWKVGDNEFQVYTVDGNDYLSYNDWEARIVDDEYLFWNWALMYEGYYQKYKVQCDCNQCHMSMSFYSTDKDDEEELGGFLIVMDMDPVDKVASPVVKTLVPLTIDNSWVGKYYRLEDSYQYETLNVSSSKLIYNESSNGYISLDIIEEVGDNEYLVHKSSSSGYSKQFGQGEWFSTIKFKVDENYIACISGLGNGTRYASFNISDNWSNYRTLAVENADYDPSKEIRLHTTDFGKCTDEVRQFDRSYEGTWQSDKGEWTIDFTNGLITPYDTRTLNYTETLDVTEDEQVSIFTYGLFNDPLSSPTRYSNLYTHTIKFKKIDSGCFMVTHNLDTEGVFGEYNLNVVKEDKLCPKNEPTMVDTFKEYRSITDNVVKINDSHIYVEYNDTVALDADIIRSYHNEVGSLYYDDLIVKQDSPVEGIWGSCTDYTHVRVYYYPEGTSSDPRSYLYIMHTPNIACFSDYDEAEEAEEAGALSYSKRKGPYYEVVE